MARWKLVMAVLGVLVSSGAWAIRVHEAAPIEVVPPSPPPRSVQAAEPEMVRAAEPEMVQAAPRGNESPRAADQQASVAIPSELFGRRWHLRVPGAAYQTENRVEGTRTLHVSPGSGRLDHEVIISGNGEYVWRAYGKKIKGRWAANARRGYPLTLLKGYEAKDWHATINNGELLLWDGRSLAGQFRGR